MAARKRRVSVQKRELDIVVSFPHDIEPFTKAQDDAIANLAKAFEARILYSRDVTAGAMVKMEKR